MPYISFAIIFYHSSKQVHMYAAVRSVYQQKDFQTAPLRIMERRQKMQEYFVSLVIDIMKQKETLIFEARSTPSLLRGARLTYEHSEDEPVKPSFLSVFKLFIRVPEPNSRCPTKKKTQPFEPLQPTSATRTALRKNRSAVKRLSVAKQPKTQKAPEQNDQKFKRFFGERKCQTIGSWTFTKQRKRTRKGIILRKRRELSKQRLSSEQPVAEEAKPCEGYDFTARSYVVLGRGNNQIFSCNSKAKVEVASLTKIFTCYFSLAFIDAMGLRVQQFVRVSGTAASMVGTSARLEPGDHVSVLDLLYGMMLPSGNDAAYSLAESIGLVIQNSKGPVSKRRKPVKWFLSQLNPFVKNLGLDNTNIANPHGLINSRNYSCALDIATLCAAAMQHTLFRKIVSTRERFVHIYNQKKRSSRTMLWRNTNRLLDSGYVGIKTGITKSAGSCFAGCFEAKEEQLIVVALGTASVWARFRETEVLVKAVLGSAYSKFQISSETKAEWQEEREEEEQDPEGQEDQLLEE